VSERVPKHARAVIVGGGIAGCSAAYHLAKLGWRDVLLLEQNRLAGGTTWHAAGMVSRLRTSHSMAILNDHSARLYATLEAETGRPTGWKQVGSLLLARTPERATQHRRTARLAALFGIDCHEISVAEAARLWPGMRTDDLLGAFWLPEDGRVDPNATTLSLARGAETHGTSIHEGVRVTGICRDGRRVTGVKTDHGDVAADVVLLCTGMWSRQFGLENGVDIPLYPVEHHYAVTEPIAGVADFQPCTRDNDGEIYFRSEGNRVILGAFQKVTKPWLLDRVPDDFSFRLLADDWEKFHPALVAGRHRLPVLQETGFDRFVNGPESFTPDNSFLLGPLPGRVGLYVAAGFNSGGIATAGGAGKAIAEWIVEGEPPMDLWSVDPRRLGPFQNNLEYLRGRVVESLGLHYQMAWPNRELETARDLRQSAVHERLAAHGACFGSKFGWERPLWFADPGTKPKLDYSFGRPTWFRFWEAEHRAAREGVALFDQSSFSKFVLSGPDACGALQRLCGNDVDVPPGRIVYTGLFNERGTFESDLTVMRLAPDEYYVVTSTAQAVRDADWIERNLGASRADLVDVSGAYGVLSVMGPHARELLQPLTDADLSNDAFPFGTTRRIGVGQSTVLAARITYVGELGWELHTPVEQMTALFDMLASAGRWYGLTLAGTTAINSLRMEKSYAAWGTELSTDDTPLEAGLGFAVAWDKPGGFLGREALLRQRSAGVHRRLVTFLLDDPEPVLWGGEPIHRDGRPVGYTTSGSYAHALGSAIGMGYVKGGGVIDAAWIRSGSYQIDIAGELFSAEPYLRAPYDPKREHILR
jgi:4-methylaminobutanoate oxidase (formaldehyde-forming)